MKQPCLLLPIETKAREFHGKVLLSCFAAEAGFEVIMGGQVDLQRSMKNLPRGTYIDKSVAPTKIENFRKCRQLGNRVVAWCEEGLVFRDRDAYLRERVSLPVFEKADLFFAWGSVQAEAMRMKVNDHGNKIVLAGNPRFDVLRSPFKGIFETDAERIRQEYGRIILLNTNFSRFNHFHSREYVLETLKKQGKIRTKAAEDFFWQWSDYLGVLYGRFMEVIPHLSKAFSEHTIILRPHPSENHNVYREATTHLQNMRVVYEGSVLPWILASDVLIHNSCTTGLEAYLLGRPVVAYCPVTSEVFDSVLPNAVSIQTTTEDDLMGTLEGILRESGHTRREKPRDPESEFLARRYITSVEGPFASERIVSELKNLTNGVRQTSETFQSSSKRRIRVTREDLLSQAKTLLNRVGIRRFRGRGYQQQKFPGISLAEIQEALAAFQKAARRFHGVKVRRAKKAASCYWIFKDKNRGSIS